MLAGVRYRVDSGWAWIVCFASFFVQCLVFGTIQSFGTLFISLLNDFKSGESATGKLWDLLHIILGGLILVIAEKISRRSFCSELSIINLHFRNLLLFSSYRISIFYEPTFKLESWEPFDGESGELKGPWKRKCYVLKSTRTCLRYRLC